MRGDEGERDARSGNWRRGVVKHTCRMARIHVCGQWHDPEQGIAGWMWQKDEPLVGKGDDRRGEKNKWMVLQSMKGRMARRIRAILDADRNVSCYRLQNCRR